MDQIDPKHHISNSKTWYVELEIGPGVTEDNVHQYLLERIAKIRQELELPEEGPPTFTPAKHFIRKPQEGDTDTDNETWVSPIIISNLSDDQTEVIDNFRKRFEEAE